MKIDKAIETLSDSAYRGSTTFNQDNRDAQKLGIEALKFYQDSSHFACGRLLPGQTGETVD